MPEYVHWDTHERKDIPDNLTDEDLGRIFPIIEFEEGRIRVGFKSSMYQPTQSTENKYIMLGASLYKKALPPTAI